MAFVCFRRGLGLLLVAAAFLTAASTPCAKARVTRRHDSAPAISAPCPCHCGEHAASAASQLDPVLRASAACVAVSARPGDFFESPASLPNAPRALPDPIPIA